MAPDPTPSRFEVILSEPVECVPVGPVTGRENRQDQMP